MKSGKRRVYTPIMLWIDPLVLNGVDEMVRRQGMRGEVGLNRLSRSRLLRDMVYAGVEAGLRRGRVVPEAPIVPFDAAFASMPRVRIAGGQLIEVDEFGLPTAPHS